MFLSVYFCFVWFFSTKGKLCYDQGSYVLFKWVAEKTMNSGRRQMGSNLDLLAITVILGRLLKTLSALSVMGDLHYTFRPEDKAGWALNVLTTRSPVSSFVR